MKTMKLIIAVAFFASLSYSSDAKSNDSHLRGANSTRVISTDLKEGKFLLEAVEDSSCINYDEKSCSGSFDSKGIACVWCTCYAIPSECFSTEQSKSLPPGVFECDSIDLNSVNHDIKPLTGADSVADVSSSLSSYVLKDDLVDGSLCDPNSKSFSGYIDITGSEYDKSGENKHLFYWFFEKRSQSQLYVESQDTVKQEADDIPLILWLTGGPGCSSTLALLTENGPCTVTSDGESTEVNPYSWTETAHVLWLDQPAGVGYSFGKATDSNEEMISEDAYYFLQEFYKKHPVYSKNPLFVVGESYGGHYAPAIAHKILLKNQSNNDNKKDLIEINLAGLAIGNGLTDPTEQYKWYPEMAYNNPHGIKAVSEATYNAMKAAAPGCVTLIEVCNKGDSFVNTFACQTAFITCNVAETSPYQMSGLNPYDIRKECGPHPLCYDFSNIEKWLNLDATKTALHISKESHHWEACNMGINFKFHVDWMKDFSPYVKDLLNSNIPALIYAGDVDFICNYMGNRAWTLNLDWKHGVDFVNAEDHDWLPFEDDVSPAGLARSANGFTFLQVYDAGHMVPSDKPSVALKMIQNFVDGVEF